MGGNKGKRYEDRAEERPIRSTSIDRYATAINAENEREFRNTTRVSLTRVAPGDERKTTKKQRLAPLDIGNEPIASCDEFTNVLLTALGWLAGDSERHVIDLLVGET